MVCFNLFQWGFEANACILAFDVTRKITYKNLETSAAQTVAYWEAVAEHSPCGAGGTKKFDITVRVARGSEIGKSPTSLKTRSETELYQEKDEEKVS